MYSKYLTGYMSLYSARIYECFEWSRKVNEHGECVIVHHVYASISYTRNIVSNALFRTRLLVCVSYSKIPSAISIFLLIQRISQMKSYQILGTQFRFLSVSLLNCHLFAYSFFFNESTLTRDEPDPKTTRPMRIKKCRSMTIHTCRLNMNFSLRCRWSKRLRGTNYLEHSTLTEDTHQRN